MPTTIAIGFSQSEDPQEAAHQASIAAKNQLNSTGTDMVVVFASIHYAKPEILDVIHTILRPARLVGASTAGILLSNGIFNRGLAILAINSHDMAFGIGAAVHGQGQSLRQTGFDLGRKIITDYNAPHPRQVSVVFCDGLFQDGSQFLRGAQEVLGYGAHLTGAFTCDDFKLKRTYQFHQKQILFSAAVGFLVGSEDPVALSSKHGFKPLGKPRLLTQVENHVIHTIDHKPAIHIYEEYFKGETEHLKKEMFNSPAMLYPLGIYLENQRQYLLRYPVDILGDGSIVCQGEVPQGAEVHLTIGNKDSCKNAATLAAQEIKNTLGGRQAQLVIIFDSMMRYKILGRYAFVEIQAIKEVLGYSTPLIGMYSFGEIAPLGLNENIPSTYLQNESLLLLAIS